MNERTADTGAPPAWLARLGRSGWMVVGIILALAATTMALFVLTPLVTPVIIAIIIAAALAPLVDWAGRIGVPRALGAVLGSLLVPMLAGLLALFVWRSVAGQSDDWDRTAAAAAQRFESGAGVDPVTPLVEAFSGADLLRGLGGLVIQGASFVVELALGVLFAIYVLFFLLKDGPKFGAGIATRLPLPPATTRQMLGTAVIGLRRYFVGTTVIAVVDAVLIGLGAVVLDMPLVVPIALVTFALAYIPYAGAWVSAAFAIVVALGSGGVETALWMLVVVLLTQNIVEGLLRPFVFGVALDMHPLTVLAVTVIGGIVGGVIGVAVAAPFTAIGLAWWRTVRSTRAAETAGEPVVRVH